VQIYAAYEIYQLSDGSEQLIFTAAGPVPRSQRLVDFIKSAVKLPGNGRLIDIGCGNGAALARYSSALPGWKLFGNELSDKSLETLRHIPNFVELFITPISEIHGRFDLVSMIHSLEHMPAPREALEHAARLVADDGILFVEVPDIETSPFDLLVADHLLHFSQATLCYAGAQAGFSASFIGNNVLPKEITMIGRSAAVDPILPVAGDGIRIARDAVDWLGQVVATAQGLAHSRPFGIFGTSISGMWLFGALRDSVSFFVDEDPSRIGGEYAGKPILSPLDAPADATVFIPLVPSVADKVAERYAQAPARFVPAPPFR